MDIKERIKNLTPEQRELLLKRLSEERAAVKESAVHFPEIVPNIKERYEPFPLNNLQQAYLLGRSTAFEMGNIPSVAYLELACENLDITKFKSAWQKLIQRHEILRSVVHSDYTQQILKETPEFKIQIDDLKKIDAEAQKRHLAKNKIEMLSTVKNSEDWPLFEVRLSRLTDNLDHVHFKLDLLNFDAGSITVLFNELKEFYKHPELEIPELELSYRDYLLTEKKFEQSEIYQRSKDYWMSRLNTIPPAPVLPLIKNPKDIEKPFFRRRLAYIDSENWKTLKLTASKSGLTPTVLLLTAYAEMLGLWSSTLKFSINIPIFNRLPLHPEVNKIIGDFSAVEILEVDRTLKQPFLEKAKEIHKQLIADLDNRYMDGITVLRELSKINGDDFMKGIPIVFTSLLDHGFAQSVSQIGKIVDSVNQTAQVWLDLHVDEVDGSLLIKFDAVEELFEGSVLDDMLVAYTDILNKLAESENNWKETNLNFFPKEQAERRKQVNNTKKLVPDELLHTLFTKVAKKQPDSTAVISSKRTLTFRELDELSNSIGNKLRLTGAKPDKLVAVIMEKGWEQIPAVYGILKAGSAYLPIDPDFPGERINQLLNDSEAEMVLTQSWLKDKLGLNENIICFCVDNDDFSDTSNAELESVQRPDDLAYVLYTSGSTGQPKGVMIEHRSVVNRMLDVNDRYEIKNTDRAIALTALQHDLSAYDIFGMLMAGGSIVIPDNNKILDPAHWTELMIEHKITFWNSVPAFLEMYVDYLENKKDENLNPPLFRMTVLSGDWIPVSLPDRLRSLKPDIRIIGSGGPTETTIWDIYNFIGKVDPEWKSIPYGKPLTNATYYVMKDNLEECPDFVTGELCIGGAGLARGFWKDEQKTREKFFQHPETGERLYKSGDLGFYRTDGMIQIAGRKDFQVKIRGLRVELGEIESILKKNSNIKDAVVSAIGDSQTNKRLVAYIVPTLPIEEPEENAKKPSPKIDDSSTNEADRDGSLLSEVEKMELKLKHLELRHDDDNKKKINLNKLKISNHTKQNYLSRQTYRTFQGNGEKISLKKFSEFISCLAQYNSDELPFPKYRYPSAGSLYPVQVYLYVKSDRIEGVEGGTYYYHPKDHRLVLLSSEPKIKKSIHTVNNYQTFEDSAFSVFLVAEMKAIAPVYGTKTISRRVGKSKLKTLLSGLHTMLVALKQQQSSADVSRDFCVLEAGYMGQLLMTASQENQIGLCPVGGVDFAQIRQYFDLKDTHIYIHGFMGGGIAPIQMKMFSLVSEMSCARSAPDPRKVLLDDVMAFLQDRIPDYMVPANFIIMKKLPLTPNGKVDRKALPVPDDGSSLASVKFAPDSLSPSVEKISKIVQNILKIENVNPSVNLFNLGATSIQIILMTNQMESKLGFRPRIDEIYADPTIAAIAKRYDKLAGTESKGGGTNEKTIEENKTLELLKKVKSLSHEEIKSKLKQMQETE